MKIKLPPAILFTASARKNFKVNIKFLPILLVTILNCYTIKSISQVTGNGFHTMSSSKTENHYTANNFNKFVSYTNPYQNTANVTPQRFGQKTTPNNPKNIIKINLSALVFKNISLQYERVIKRKMSVALGIAVMPKTGLPFKQTLMDEFGNNADAKRAIETTKLSNFSITPEIRFYAGRKGAPAGFYVAPFLRYNSMNFEQLYEFTASDGKLYHPFITGTINNFGGGILLGAQWHLSKTLTFDWWIAGPSYGTLNGDLSGTENMSTMSAADKQKLERDIEDVDLPLIKTDATVGNNKVDVKLSGSYVGLRTFGFAIGFKF